MQLIGSISSGSNPERTTVPIAFPSGWDGYQGPLFEWYEKLPSKSTNRLQIRIDTSGAVPHRFIVAHLKDNTIQRFDRRPTPCSSGKIVAAGLLSTTIIPARDEIQLVKPETWQSLEKRTKCEIELHLETDVLFILSACYGINRDSDAQNYALFQYNCYFFSWTILAIVARHKVPDIIPQAICVFDRLRPKLEDLTVTLAEELSQAVINATVEIVMAFSQEIGYVTLIQGGNWIDKCLWSLPVSVLRFIMQSSMAFRLHPKLKPHLQSQLFSELKPKLCSMLETQLDIHLTTAGIFNSLWLSEIQQVIETSLKVEVTNILWDALWNTVGGAGSKIHASEVVREVTEARIAEGRSDNSVQFHALWNAALHTALPAFRQSAYGRIPSDTVTRADIFDKAWDAGRDAALEAAQAVIKDTAQLNTRKRDVLWARVWEVWNGAWKVAHTSARESVLASVESMVNALVNGVVEAIVLELGSPHLGAESTKVLMEQDELSSLLSFTASMTHAELQGFIQKMIKANSLEYDSFLIAKAMGRIWQTSRLNFTEAKKQM